MSLKTDFPSGLQVIFKLTNVYLSPEKHTCYSSDFQIEGALNDRIVAIAFYCYDVENISESRLWFKQTIHAETQTIEQPLDRLGVEKEFHSMRWFQFPERPIQTIGSVLMRPGRMLAFPNVFQHQEEGVGLLDPAKPGYRKMLAMFLVDPNIRVLSTGVVQPQQKDWWVREVRKISPFSKVPMEIFDIIMNFVHGFRMSWKDAKCIQDGVERRRISQYMNWREEKLIQREEVFEHSG
ncbi:hypothetical protein F4781DRAFT_402292 [Annulohypoxylon bovei var. microspora]|nr:hypothetical protein F4781DRAFT_402292 [Annulohypoxylon bovei var. microspora]